MLPFTEAALFARRLSKKMGGGGVVVVVGEGWSLESVNAETAGASHSQSIQRSVCVPLTRRGLWTLSAALFLSSQITAFQTGSSPRHGSAGRRRHPGSCSGNVKNLVRGEVALRPGSAHFFFLPQLLLAFLPNVKSFTWNELHKTFGENSWRMSGAGP